MSVNADSFLFRSYAGGIIDWLTCGTNVGHAVLVVGYGVEGTDTNDALAELLGSQVAAKGKEYFIIKNSWGSEWGENGFARIMSSQLGSEKGVCGLFTEGYFPQVKSLEEDAPQ